jgi:polygalacturonase
MRGLASGAAAVVGLWSGPTALLRGARRVHGALPHAGMASRRWRLASAACLVLLVAGVARAQDTRVVTEPKIPESCARLGARLQGVGASIREEDEGKLDTQRIQKALDECKPGQAVELTASVTLGKDSSNTPPTNAFLSGPLELREGVTLLIDKGVTLYGSRDPKVYEIPNPDAKPGEAGKCGTSMPRPTSFPTFAVGAGRPRGGCRSLITINVKNAAIMGDGVIDGRGYAKLIGHDYSWWEQARKAEPHDDLYYNTRLISANKADGLVLYRITLHNSPNFHVSVNGTDGFTAWGVHLQTPVDKKYDARNTDGIDPGNSTNITVTHSWIDNGDDNIAIKQGVSHMSVLDNHFYSGHGMSIGSETLLGQSYLLVDGLTEDHTTSGIRIKSNVKRGGPVHDLVYRNICMRGVQNPIAISPYYTNQTVEPFDDPKYVGDKIPDYKRITLSNIFDETPGDVLIAGLNDEHRTQVTLDHVVINGIKPGQVHLDFADIALQGSGTNFPLEGKSVKVTGTQPIVKRVADPCAGKFVPMH